MARFHVIDRGVPADPSWTWWGIEIDLEDERGWMNVCGKRLYGSWIKIQRYCCKRRQGSLFLGLRVIDSVRVCMVFYLLSLVVCWWGSSSDEHKKSKKNRQIGLQSYYESDPNSLDIQQPFSEEKLQVICHKPLNQIKIPMHKHLISIPHHYPIRSFKNISVITPLRSSLPKLSSRKIQIFSIFPLPNSWTPKVLEQIRWPGVLDARTSIQLIQSCSRWWDDERSQKGVEWKLMFCAF